MSDKMRQALRIARNALLDYGDERHIAPAVEAIDAALAEQPAQGEAVVRATVIKRGAERTWMSERMGELPDGTYSLYTAPPAPSVSVSVPDIFRSVQDAKKNAQTSLAEDEYSALLKKLSGRDFDLLQRAMLAAAPEMPK